MSRGCKWNGAEQRQHQPGKAGHGKCLLTREAPRLDAQEAQRRARDQEDAGCEQVTRRRGPFAEEEGHHKRRRQPDGRDEDQRAQVMADDAQVVE